MPFYVMTAQRTVYNSDGATHLSYTVGVFELTEAQAKTLSYPNVVQDQDDEVCKEISISFGKIYSRIDWMIFLENVKIFSTPGAFTAHVDAEQEAREKRRKDSWKEAS